MASNVAPVNFPTPATVEEIMAASAEYPTMIEEMILRENAYGPR